MAKAKEAPVNEDPTNLPAISEDDLRDVGFPTGIKMAPGLALFMNDRVYRRCRAVALDLSSAEAIMPGHLLGKPAAVFAIVSISITWNLSPILVARCTYQTPGGGIGFMGVLVQAILENSGQVEGNVKFELIGDWHKIRGKFKMVKGERGKDFPAQDWKPEDEVGLGVIVSAQIRGEAKERTETFYLNEFNPRFSTLWATRPWQQIRYTAVRAFANIACPGLLMGLPFDVDPQNFYGEPEPPMQEINPRPAKKNEFDRPKEAKRQEPGPEEHADDKAVKSETKTAASAAPPAEKKKPEPAPPAANEQLEREAEQADSAALQGEDPPPAEQEPTKDAQSEHRAWFVDMLALVPGVKTIDQAVELADDVAPNLDGSMRDEWAIQIETKLLDLMAADLAGPDVKYVRDVTKLRETKAVSYLSGARLQQWKAMCDKRQNAILEALRKK